LDVQTFDYATVQGYFRGVGVLLLLPKSCLLPLKQKGHPWDAEDSRKECSLGRRAPSLVNKLEKGFDTLVYECDELVGCRVVCGAHTFCKSTAGET